jgi:hypothetical protein
VLPSRGVAGKVSVPVPVKRQRDESVTASIVRLANTRLPNHLNSAECSNGIGSIGRGATLSRDGPAPARTHEHRSVTAHRALRDLRVLFVERDFTKRIA